MRKILFTALLLILAQSLSFGFIRMEKVEDFGTTVYKFSNSREMNITDRTVNPTYLIYPDSNLKEKDAKKFYDGFGLDDNLDLFQGVAYVVNPVGDKYDSEADLEVYYKLLESLKAINNLKIIAKGDGATFVNNVISQHCEMVAGILTIGGEVESSVLKDGKRIPVPAYIVGNNKDVTELYVKANDAVPTKGKKSDVYENAMQPYAKVVLGGKKLSDSEAFQNAWKTIFSKNYRYNNYHTWYMGTDLRNCEPFEFVSWVMFDDLGIKRNIVKKNICGWGDFLWYEYVPEKLSTSAKVPLVVMLHGNNNDPRTQAETSGWVELASSEGFIAIELEWQGNGYAAMGLDGIEATIKYVMGQYPQIDPSRVYVTGLSAGGMNTTYMCIFKSTLIAAGASMAGGLLNDTGVGMFGTSTIDDQIKMYNGKIEIPYMICAGTNDSVFTDVPAASDGRTPKGGLLRAVNALAKLNGIEIGTEGDTSLDPIFGMKVENRQAIKTVDNLTMHVGTFSKGNKPMIRVVALEQYGHWNYKGVAPLMWEFFKNYSRDPETKALFYHGR